MAFVLARPLRGPGVTVAEAIAAVGFVLPALELIDSRIRDWKIGLADTIADNASSGGRGAGQHAGAAVRRSTCGWPAATCTGTASWPGPAPAARCSARR